MAVNHPQFGTFCAICFHGLTQDTCVIDTAGVRWDICPGECARQAGITERRPPPGPVARAMTALHDHTMIFVRIIIALTRGRHL